MELHLGAHDSCNKSSVLKSLERVDEILDLTSGKVYVLLEGLATARESEIFENRTESGILPNLAYLFMDKTDKNFSSNKGERFLKELTFKIQTGQHPYDAERISRMLGDDFRSVELAYLDSLFLKYMDKKDRSRLGVLIEGTADDVEIDLEALKEDDKEIFKQSMDGNFNTALDLFKKDTQKTASDSLIRENMITNQITDHIKNGVSAIIARFGSNHTGIYHRLSRQGINNLSRVFIDNKDKKNQYYFEPMSVVIRKIMNQGAGSLSELDWYRGLIGHTVFQFLYEYFMPGVEDCEDTELLYQDLILASFKFSAMIENYQDVEEIRVKGIESTIGEIIESGANN